MRVLVTGGLGFIGRHIVDELVGAGHDVLIVDCAVDADGSEPSPVREGVDCVAADLSDREVATRVTAGIDAVSHQAAMVGLGIDFSDVAHYVTHNDLATAHLLAALHDREFTGRFVLASSMVVYGEGRYRCESHGIVGAPARDRADLEAGRFEPRCSECGAGLRAEPVPERAPIDPRNVYAATKAHQEHLVASYRREHPGTTATFLRYHNVYGPHMPRDTPYAGVASIFRSALERGEAPLVFEDGAQTRDFVHVSDVARANRLALECDPVDGPVNVCSGEPHTVLEMALALGEAFGVGKACDPREPVVTGSFRMGDVRHVFASPRRAAEELGFRARVPFGRGMVEFARAPLRSASRAQLGGG